jgi:predicted DNA-binding transcriptional regulator AlpA
MAESDAGRSTFMRALKELEASGFITREPQLHDSGARRSTAAHRCGHTRSAGMYPNSIQEEVKELENNVFDQLPLLLAVPRAAAILGISRAAAYRLAASGELPVRRLGGRVYVVTAELRELVAS